ncbi:MAG TPA: hypothetical protein PLZ60_09940 [Kiritimatiellia bacterium]|nr:hypothetical protein [Kiritimatiellia bacterium]
MGFVTEEIEHDELPVTLITVEREAGETREAWRFVSLDAMLLYRGHAKIVRNPWEN